MSAASTQDSGWSRAESGRLLGREPRRRRLGRLAGQRGLVHVDRAHLERDAERAQDLRPARRGGGEDERRSVGHRRSAQSLAISMSLARRCPGWVGRLHHPATPHVSDSGALQPSTTTESHRTRVKRRLRRLALESWRLRRASFVVLLLQSSAALAVNPLVVDDAGTVDPCQLQLNAGWRFARTSPESLYAVPVNPVLGVSAPREVGVTAAYERESGGDSVADWRRATCCSRPSGSFWQSKAGFQLERAAWTSSCPRPRSERAWAPATPIWAGC